MTGGEDESVAVEPTGIRRINLKSLTKENGPDVGGTQRKSEMARLAGSDGIDGESASIAGGELEDCVVHKISSSAQTEGTPLASLHPNIFAKIRSPG
jgi:hypothetical protein